MIDFIICDNDPIVLKDVQKIIRNRQEYFNIYAFHDYDDAFLAQIYEPTNHKKIFILDIEAESMNGLDVARLIRKTDQNSIIMFLTGYQAKYNYAILKIGIRYDCVIEKGPHYLEELASEIDKYSQLVLTKRYIKLEEKNISYEFLLDDILYFTTNKTNGKTVIQLSNRLYEIRMPLKKIESLLTSSFEKTHRACIINKNRVAVYDYKNNRIIFDNKKEIHLLSRDYKKRQKEKR